MKAANDFLARSKKLTGKGDDSKSRRDGRSAFKEAPSNFTRLLCRVVQDPYRIDDVQVNEIKGRTTADMTRGFAQASKSSFKHEGLSYPSKILLGF